jgi:hypothetical protein
MRARNGQWSQYSVLCPGLVLAGSHTVQIPDPTENLVPPWDAT